MNKIKPVRYHNFYSTDVTTRTLYPSETVATIYEVHNEMDDYYNHKKVEFYLSNYYHITGF